MLKSHSMKRRSASVLIWTIALGTISYAQTSSSPRSPAPNQGVVVDAEFLKAAQLAIAERDKFKAQYDAMVEVSAAKDAQIAALRSLLQVQQQISDDWKAAAMQRKDALATTDKLIATYDARVLQLERDLGAARRSRNRWAVVGVVVGAALGLFAAK